MQISFNAVHLFYAAGCLYISGKIVKSRNKLGFVFSATKKNIEILCYLLIPRFMKQ